MRFPEIKNMILTKSWKSDIVKLSIVFWSLICENSFRKLRWKKPPEVFNNKRCSYKFHKVSFLIKLNFIKKRLRRRWFLVNFVKFFMKIFLQNTSRLLLPLWAVGNRFPCKVYWLVNFGKFFQLFTALILVKLYNTR